MLPASFAPMILKLIMPKIMDHFMATFKLDKVLSYVEQPNELDKKANELDIEVKKHQTHIDMLVKELTTLENRLNKLEILSQTNKKIKQNGK